MRVVLDAMGGDNYPTPELEGAIAFAKKYPQDTVVLVGKEAFLKEKLAPLSPPPNIEIVHAEVAIGMDEAVTDIPRDLQSSMHIGMNLVKDQLADGFVTLGNSAVALAIATLHTLRRMRGVKRPVLTGKYRLGGHDIVILDIGANTGAKADWIAQHALIGSIYAQQAYGISSPRVALLSVGEEEGKGGELIKETSALIRQMPLRYVGNIEPKQILQGVADVIVTDGFTGNIALKTYEGTMRFVGSVLKQELNSTWLARMGYLLAKSAFDKIRNRLVNLDTGGGVLLGVNGLVVIGHGSADSREVFNCLVQIKEAVAGNLITTLKEQLGTLGVSE